jgi:hypothetical protein
MCAEKRNGHRKFGGHFADALFSLIGQLFVLGEPEFVAAFVTAQFFESLCTCSVFLYGQLCSTLR